MVIAVLITALLFFIPALIIGNIWYKNPIALLISIELFVFSLFFFICFSLWNNPFNGFYKSIPDKITIDKKMVLLKQRALDKTVINAPKKKRVQNELSFLVWITGIEPAWSPIGF